MEKDKKSFSASIDNPVYFKQKNDFDCGYACLKMLGIDSYKLFSEKSISSKDLKSLGFIESVKKDLFESKKAYILLFQAKQNFGNTHWVIVYKNKIYCPSLGIFDKKEYEKKYINTILQIFEKDNSKKEYKNFKKKEVLNPIVGEEYIFNDRKVKFLGFRKLSTGISQFELEFLDNPKNELETKKGDIEFFGDWKLEELEK